MALRWLGYQDLNLGPLPYQVSSVSSPTCAKPGSGVEWLPGSSRDDLRWTASSGTKRARLERANSGCGVSPCWCREDPAACRVGSEGLKQRGRQPIRRGVRGGSPAFQLCALLIRRFQCGHPRPVHISPRPRACRFPLFTSVRRTTRSFIRVAPSPSRRDQHRPVGGFRPAARSGIIYTWIATGTASYPGASRRWASWWKDGRNHSRRFGHTPMTW